MAVSVPKGGIKNRNLAIGETFYHRVHDICSGSVCNDGDTYAIGMIEEPVEVVAVQGWAGTVVGGTTVNADVRKNGVSILTTPISFVTKQQTIIAGVLGSVTRIGQNDILSVKFTRVGAGSFGQVIVSIKVRPLVGTETRL